MEFYILDDNFNKISVIEKYTSAVWTERYSKAGDFEFLFSGAKTPSGFDEGVFIGERESQEIGIIETIEYDYKQNTAKASGFFLPKFLENRVLRVDYDSTDKNVWKIGPCPPETAMTYLMVYMVQGAGYGANGLPNPDREEMSKLDMFLPGTNPEEFPTSPVGTYAVPFGTVYDGLVSIAEPEGVGWGLYAVPNASSYDLYYRHYRGVDRSKDQSTHEVVIFEPALDTLMDTKEIHSIAGYRNIVHTFAPNIDPSDYGYAPADIRGYAAVPGAEDLRDFKRRTMFVNYDDLTVEDYGSVDGIIKLWETLNRRAKDVLANNNYVRLLDGQIVPQARYTYGLDYYMGDIITLKGVHDVYQKARIVEYIRSKDATGEKAYPTLSVID
jgi:hypothetical protein